MTRGGAQSSESSTQSQHAVVLPRRELPLRISWDVGAAVSQTTLFGARAQDSGAPLNRNNPWLGLRNLGSTIRFDIPHVQLIADGSLQNSNTATAVFGGASGLVATPAVKGFRLLIASDVHRRALPEHDSEIATNAMPLPHQVPSWQNAAAIKVAYARNRNGWWIGAERHSDASSGDSALPTSVATGLSRQLRAVSLELSMGSQSGRVAQCEPILAMSPANPSPGTHVDTIVFPCTPSGTADAKLRTWSELAAQLGWARGRVAFDAVLNRRPRVGIVGPALWGEAVGVVAVASHTAFIASVRAAAPPTVLQLAPKRTVSFGLRIAPAALWRSSSVPPLVTRSVSTAFRLQQIAPGEYLMSLRVPNARAVEIAGDFTGWKAVALNQIDNTRWEVSIRMAPGVHRCNIRIDGAEWVPPPHVTAVNDEFNGRVGLIVVE